MKKLKGVVDADVIYKEKEAKVYYEEGKLTVSEMIKTIENVEHYIALILQQD